MKHTLKENLQVIVAIAAIASVAVAWAPNAHSAERSSINGIIHFDGVPGGGLSLTADTVPVLRTNFYDAQLTIRDPGNREALKLGYNGSIILRHAALLDFAPTVHTVAGPVAFYIPIRVGGYNYLLAAHEITPAPPTNEGYQQQ